MLEGCNQFNVSFWNRNDNKCIYQCNNLYIYFVSGVAFLIFQICLTNSFVQATSKIHSTILNRIFHSPMSFFHTTPIGRIINRFSSDIDVLDDRFPRFCNFFIVMFSTLLSTVVVIVMETPLVLAVITPMTVLYVVCIVSTKYSFSLILCAVIGYRTLMGNCQLYANNNGFLKLLYDCKWRNIQCQFVYGFP
jgi:ABC-type multidrug transport system fused ATPase/permease subunit